MPPLSLPPPPPGIRSFDGGGGPFSSSSLASLLTPFALSPRSSPGAVLALALAPPPSWPQPQPQRPAPGSLASIRQHALEEQLVGRAHELPRPLSTEPDLRQQLADLELLMRPLRDGTSLNTALETLVFEVQRLTAVLLRGADFALLDRPGASWSGAAPRLRVRLQLGEDLRTFSLEPQRSSFCLLDVTAVRVEADGGGRRFSLQLGAEGAPLSSSLQLLAPDSVLAADFVGGLTLLHALAASCGGGGSA